MKDNPNIGDTHRSTMQWDGTANAGFTTGTPFTDWVGIETYTVNDNYMDYNVEAEMNNQDSIFACYKTLIRIRKGNDALSKGDLHVALATSSEHSNCCTAFVRSYQNNLVVIALNPTGNDVTDVRLDLSDSPRAVEEGEATASSDLLDESPSFGNVTKDNYTAYGPVNIPAYGARILPLTY